MDRPNLPPLSQEAVETRDLSRATSSNEKTESISNEAASSSENSPVDANPKTHPYGVNVKDAQHEFAELQRELSDCLKLVSYWLTSNGSGGDMMERRPPLDWL